MKFYLSSRLTNREQVRYVADRLKAKGWIHTCDWTNFDAPSEDAPDGLRIIGEREWEGVKAAELILVLTPQGRGTHIELGMGIGLGKRVYLYHEDDSYFKQDEHTCAFYWLPQVKQLTGTIDSAIEVILQENLDIG